MKNINIFLQFCILLVFFQVDVLNSQVKEYNNPIIAGFNPDPSVCRVGDDYYLVTSTFEYFPGVPVYHSKDLVNWNMIGHVLHRPEQLDLENVASTAGIYAPTIRYHNGTFYMITTLIAPDRDDKPKGNFIVTATNPAGPWSNPHWIEGAVGIDPSLFFDDDGKAYYCGNRNSENQEFRAEKQIWIQEIDLQEFKLKGKIGLLDSKPYYKNNIIGSVEAMEAPHIYKKDGVYYLLVAHGGTGMGHAVSIWKSNTPFGSWEDNPDNPILTHRGYSQSGINATGHADVFQTHNGNWWSVFLAVRSNNEKQNVMGRETFLAPLDWSGTWPVYNPEGIKGRTAFKHKAPSFFNDVQQNQNFEDDFNNNSLNLKWTMIRTPKEKWWDLESEKGKLKLKLRSDEINQFAQPSFLGIRVPDMKVEIISTLDFTPKNANECAGLAFERGHDEEWTLVKELLENRQVVSVYYDRKKLLGQIELKTETPIKLKIQLIDFKMTFYVQEKDYGWLKITETDASSLGFPPAGRFTGSLAGPYASSRGNESNDWAFFEDFSLNKI